MIGKVLDDEETKRLMERMKRMAGELEEYGNAAAIVLSMEDRDGAYLLHVRKGNYHLVRGMMTEYVEDWGCGRGASGRVNDDGSSEAEIPE
jgi:hypothetical protein